MTETAPRKPLIVANWKMNKTQRETEDFIKPFLKELPDLPDREVVLCPPFTSLATAHNLVAGSKVLLGAQNLSEQESGAYTGEVSSSMLLDAGCKFVIIGHSERRQYQKESNELINAKTKKALAAGLTPILCVGEVLEERESGKTMAVVSKQVKEGLLDIPSADMKKMVIAYEPVWAIGTGKTATPAQAQEVHLGIRDILKNDYGSQTSLSVRILYGGSVKPDNMNELMACEDIDGGLVGGASLKPDSFLKIAAFTAGSPAGK